MGEVEAYQALGSKSRLDILKLLYSKPRSVEEISNVVGLQPITVRHHLQSLEDAGFIESHEERQGTVGRPKVYYRIAKEPQLVGFPKRRYLTLSSFILNTMRFLLGDERAKKLLRKAGIRMGENIMKKLELDNDLVEWSLKNFEGFFIGGYLEESGAEPEIVEFSDNRVVYRVHNCVFFELAMRMPELMCQVLHEGFHEGISIALNEKAKISRLTCMGEGDLYCEHLCEWQVN